MKTALCLLLLFSLAACASPSSSKGGRVTVDTVVMSDVVRLPVGGDISTAQPIEAVYGVAAGKTGLRIRVSSNGCTKKEDFRVVPQTRPTAPGASRSIMLLRANPDPCQSFAIGSTYIEFTYDELGVSSQERLRLTNPLTAWNGPGE